MFNKNFVINNTEMFPEETRVDIHNAPTIKSVELLRELEKEALNSIINVINVQNNLLNFSIHVIHNPFSFSSYAIVKYKLNNKEYKFDIDLPDKFEAKNVHEVIEIVLNGISKEISAIFTKEIINQMAEEGLLKR